MGGGWKSLVLSLDSVSVLKSFLLPKFSSAVVERLVAGKRSSTLYQQNVVWKAFQDFVRSNDPGQPDVNCLLEFCIWLRESRGLATTTINNYKAAVGQFLSMAYDLNVNSWDFKALKNNLFLEKPPNPPRVPSWDINKVLLLLRSVKYISSPPDTFCQLKKSLFLIAMATGNRVSELANFSRTGLGKIDPNQSVKLCVLPGFIYKIQRFNRTPP